MPSKKSAYNPRKSFRAKLERLQRSGIMTDVDPTKKPTDAVKRRLHRYQGILTGREAAIKATTAAQARVLRKKFNLSGSGKTVIIPREKGEKFRITSDNKIKSTRHVYGQTVSKEFGKRIEKPKDNVRRYYTIPERTRGAGTLKRRTFSSFDELLFYLTKYEVNFEEIEDRIEVEEFVKGGKRDRARASQIHDERARAVRRLKRKRKAKSRRGRRK